jgi:transcriptional regulator with XRE-family HTH domain
VADNLWAIREQKRISVAGLANRAGLPIGLIMEYESASEALTAT